MTFIERLLFLTLLGFMAGTLSSIGNQLIGIEHSLASIASVPK
jgi:hypothetical protein